MQYKHLLMGNIKVIKIITVHVDYNEIGQK